MCVCVHVREVWCIVAIPPSPPHQSAGEKSIANLDRLYTQCRSGRSTAELRLELQRIMHNNAGVYRNQELLAEGCSKLHQLAQAIPADLKVGAMYTAQ